MYNIIKTLLYRIFGLKVMTRMKNLNVNRHYYKRMRFSKQYDADTFYFVFSPYTDHPGLSDRLKPLVTCYNFAKRYGYKFRIVFKQPFALEDYIVPNKVDWVADFSDLHYSIGHTLFFNERNIQSEDAWKEVHLKPGKEYHCYNYIGNWQPKVFPDTGYQWSDLFNELFRPCGELQARLEAYPFKPKTYVAVHLRFVNALDFFENPSCYDNPIGDEKSKLELIDRCKKGIMEIMRKNDNCDVLVFSDSSRFLNSLADIPVHVLGGVNHIAHVSFSEDREATLKTFVDLYMISRAKKVYRIDAPEIYNLSGFAYSGSMIGNIPFETFNV